MSTCKILRIYYQSFSSWQQVLKENHAHHERSGANFSARIAALRDNSSRIANSAVLRYYKQKKVIGILLFDLGRYYLSTLPPYANKRQCLSSQYNINKSRINSFSAAYLQQFFHYVLCIWNITHTIKQVKRSPTNTEGRIWHELEHVLYMHVSKKYNSIWGLQCP